MLYTVKAYRQERSPTGRNPEAPIKVAEDLEGYAATESFRKEWESQGYEVVTTMEALKYIEREKVARPLAFQPRLHKFRTAS